MNNKLPKEQETFNEETISALNEVDEMRKHPEQYPSYTSRFNLSAYLISRISDG